MSSSERSGKVEIAGELGGKLRPETTGNGIKLAIEVERVRFL
jgi:hypothetical protein